MNQLIRPGRGTSVRPRASRRERPTVILSTASIPA